MKGGGDCMQEDNSSEGFENSNLGKRKKRGFSIPQISPAAAMPFEKRSQTEKKSSDHKKQKKDSKKKK